MDFSTSIAPEGVRVALSGKLTFEDNARFRQILALLQQAKPRAIEMDFADLAFVDSAGLGMLLLLRQECQNDNIALTLRAARGQVERIFSISKFDQLFTCKAS